MKPHRILKAVLLAAVLAAALAPSLAEARGGRHHGGGFRIGAVGLGLGLGFALAAPAYAYGPRYYAPAYYAPPYVPPYYAPAYYAPPAVYAPAYAPPAVYAPDYGYTQAPVQPQASNAWYFCASSNGYYPYVRQCAEGWQQVAPQPR